MNILHAILDEIIEQQPYLRWYQPLDDCIELLIGDAKGSVRQDNDRLYVTRYANVEDQPLAPTWSPVAVATISLFDPEFLNKTLRVAKEMFNIIPAIRQILEKSHPTVFWRQFNENCIETTSEPQVTITYKPDINAIVFTTCYVSETPWASYQSHEITSSVDLLNPNLVELILQTFARHRA